MSSGLVLSQSARRRSFAIVSHPDAGKTTLTEKLLLYSGAIEVAGSVKARNGGHAAVSDWAEIEQQRGISVSSTALRFEHRGHALNLLDTPGHRDFSEDTYRVLTAVDAVVMVLDAAKGVEERTLRLFEVCRSRGTPLLTFVNKCDRPAASPLALLDEIEEKLDVQPTPVTWPVGTGSSFQGVIDRRDGLFRRFHRTARGATEAPEERIDRHRLRDQGPEEHAAAEELDLLEAIGADHDRDRSWPGGPRRSSLARPCGTSAYASSWTRSSIWLPHPARARTSPAGCVPWMPPSPGRCSRSRRISTRGTATGSRSCASTPAGSSGGCR